MKSINWKLYGKISVYIDNANLIHSPKKIGWFVGLENIANFFKRSQKLVEVKLFDSIPQKEDLDHLRQFHKRFFSQDEYDTYLKRSEKQQQIFEKAQKTWGIQTVIKPLRFIVDYKKHRVTPKGDCDIDLVVDIIRRRKNYDTLFLIAGDGDYVALVNYLKQCQKRVVVMSDRGLIANILINAANEYWPFTRFRKELEFKKRR